MVENLVWRVAAIPTFPMFTHIVRLEGKNYIKRR
jgi:hypothetical protein